MSNLEAENERLRAARALSAAPSGPEKWAVETTGAGRRLSQSCCRWTNGGTCLSADVTTACTRLHEYMEHKTTTHVFEDVSSCPGSDPSALFHAQTAEVAMSSGGSEVARVPTPLRVTHASDCTGATMRVQLNTTVGGNLDVEGSLTVGGVSITGGSGGGGASSYTLTNGDAWYDDQSQADTTSGWRCDAFVTARQLGSFSDCYAWCDAYTAYTCVAITYARLTQNAANGWCRLHTAGNACCTTAGVTTGCIAAATGWGVYANGK